MNKAANTVPGGRLVARRLVLYLFASLLPGLTWSDQGETVKVVDGVQIMLGLLPSEMILGHPVEHTESSMHDAPRVKAGRYHVLIVLFDTKTNSLIRDAQVRATVREPGLPGIEKKLDPMKIGDTLSYGNYFDMPGTESYVIVVRVQRPIAPVVEARFEHRHR